MDRPKYKRVVLKLSGEALAGQHGNSIDPSVISSIAEQIKEVVELNVEVAIVVGAEHMARHRRQRERHGPDNGRLYGNVGHGYERLGFARRFRERWRPDARTIFDRNAANR